MNDLMTIIEWWVVPIVLFYYLLYLLFFTPAEEAQQLIKVSSKYGKGAGFIILALFIISRKTSQDIFSFQIPSYQFDYVSTFLATVIGFLFFLFFNTIKDTRFLGIVSFILTSALSITIYSYFFVSEIRSKIVFWALGVTLGSMLKKMMFPELDPGEVEKKSEAAPSK
ncbi:MAG: hypothetical protein HQM08_29965 [Candidatus Riflebacteria bacterium]|nr:hypothetical protein [Candidatus Riflebacteria bacterium]